MRCGAQRSFTYPQFTPLFRLLFVNQLVESNVDFKTNDYRANETAMRMCHRFQSFFYRITYTHGIFKSYFFSYDLWIFRKKIIYFRKCKILLNNIFEIFNVFPPWIQNFKSPLDFQVLIAWSTNPCIFLITVSSIVCSCRNFLGKIR